MTHRELCFDLAYAKGSQYVEVPLGSVWLTMNELGRADVVVIKPSYTKFNLDIYECKVSRSDFLSEIRNEKYKQYLNHCHRFYFAVRKGIADKREIPEGIGLWIRGEKGWKCIKPAKKRDVKIPEQTLLYLLFYRGRVFNSRRENLLRNYQFGWSGRKPFQGLNKEVKEALSQYKNLEIIFNNLLWEAAELNGKERWDEMNEWVKKWKRDHKINLY